MMRLLRPTRSGRFWRSFRLHSTHYARETIAKSARCGSLRCAFLLRASPGRPSMVARATPCGRTLATAIISQTGS